MSASNLPSPDDYTNLLVQMEDPADAVKFQAAVAVCPVCAAVVTAIAHHTQWHREVADHNHLAGQNYVPEPPAGVVRDRKRSLPPVNLEIDDD